MKKIFITGDKHGDFNFLPYICDSKNTKKDDCLIILGDAGLTYNVSCYLDDENKNLKYKLFKGSKKLFKDLNNLPITLFCIQGNHEARPELIKDFQEKIWNDGIVYYYKDAPNILFAKNGETYLINGKKYLVIGGAYSVDKYYRQKMGYAWFEEEQLSQEEKDDIYKYVEENPHIDIVLTHTCPYKYMPRELFLKGLDQSTVDNSMEYFLDSIDDILEYKKWYFGHYHGDRPDKNNSKVELLFNDIKEI